MADGLQTWSTNEVVTATKLNKVSRRAFFDQSSAPGTPLEGMHWYNTSNGLDSVYDGSNWLTLPQGIIDHDTIDGTTTGLFNTTPTLVIGSGMVWAAITDEWYAYDLSVVCQTNTNGDTLNIELEINDGGGYTSFDVLSSVALPFLGVGYRSTIRAVWRSGVDGFVGIRANASVLVGAGALTSNTDVTLTHLGNRAA